MASGNYQKAVAVPRLRRRHRAPWCWPRQDVISALMWCAKIRRISVVLLALAFAVGTVTHGVANPQTMLKATMAATASNMSMSGHCDGCDNSKDMAASVAVFFNSAGASHAPTLLGHV